MKPIKIALLIIFVSLFSFQLSAVANDKTGDCCLEKFVDPRWMSTKRILGMQLTNNVINSIGNLTRLGMAVGTDNFAVLSENSTLITHRIAGTIDAGILVPKNGDPTAPFFTNQLNLTVYTIQNSENKFLTVLPNTDQKSTNPDNDVTGVKLGWTEAIAYDDTKNYRYDLTQYFAIIDLCENSDLEDISAPYQRFVYLPLASYIVNYADGSLVMDSENYRLRYNTAIGAIYLCNNKEGAAIQEAFRIGHYSVLESNRYDLVVVGASGESATNNVPVEFTWTPGIYDTQFDCNEVIISNNDGTIFYNLNGIQTEQPDKYSLLAHWKINRVTEFVEIDKEIIEVVVKDPYLMKITSEINRMYGNTINPEQLTGEYYFKILETIEEDDAVIGYKLKSFDFSGDDLEPNIDTIYIYCTEHDLPYYNLERHWNIEWMKLAAFEAVFQDRNLYIDSNDRSSCIYDGDKLVAYRARVNNVTPAAETGITYLTIHRNLTRDLAPDNPGKHTIPYYNFSITVGNDEYFLNVIPGVDDQNDSVRFTKLQTDEIDILLNYKEYPGSMPLYTFCLPYAYAFNDIDYYFDEKNPAVYLQTLDLKAGISDPPINNEEAPYIIHMGANSKLVTAKRIDEVVIQNGLIDKPFIWNIYEMNYNLLDSEYVTAFIFDQQIQADVEWVRLAIPVNKGIWGTGSGILANADIASVPGEQYIKPSGDRVNYGTTTTTIDQASLKFIYVGKAGIGNHNKKEIWYYKIQDTNGDFLTNASFMDSNKPYEAPYFYTWTGVSNKKFPYAFFDFGEFLPHSAYENYQISEHTFYNVYADKNFIQSFGLRYTKNGREDNENQKFHVVSKADFTNRINPERDYMYLACVQNRYIFVDNREAAMTFSFGNNKDGEWTEIKEIQSTTINGGKGFVSIRNAEGRANIYTIDGRLLNSIEIITSTEQTIPTPAGIMIVKIGNNVTKVIVP